MRNKENRLVHWSPSKNYSRAQSLCEEVGNGTIYCQAVVQILFADSNKEWTIGQIGEFVLYKSCPKRPADSSDLFLSFFASERYRFLIKLSEGAKCWRTNKNFVAILHGRLIGLNFAIEHSHQADLLIKYMQGFHPPKLLSERFFRALKHFQMPKSNKNSNKQEYKSQINAEIPQRQYLMDSESIQKTNFATKKKQVKIESGMEEPDPILQPREFLNQMASSVSEEI